MNAIINQIQVWYCDICDKTTAIKTKRKHFICKSHKQKKHMVLLLNNTNSLIQTLMMWILYSMILLKVVEKSTFSHLNIDVYMLLNSETWKIMKMFF